MKRILIVINVIVIIILAYFTFQYCKYVSSHPAPISATDCENCCQEIDNNPSSGNSEAFAMNKDDVRLMVADYTNNHWRTINSANNATATEQCWVDSRAVWFSLSRLKGFIKAIEEKSHDVIPDCCDSALGIRIYYATYSHDLVKKFRLDAPFEGRHTVVMVPTYQCDTTSYDFNPLHEPTKARTCCSNDSTQWTSGTVMALTAMNHGNIIPPPYPDRSCPEYYHSGAEFLLNVVDPTVSINPLPAGCSCTQ